MSKYGIKIQTYEAASILEFNNGARNSYDVSTSFFANSLLSDFLFQNGLKKYYRIFNRDKQFYEWKKSEKGAWTRDLICVDFSYGIKANIEKALKKTREELRILFYTEGVSIKYSDTEVHYKMLYRTSGKAKDGSCIFIKESLYKKTLSFIRMGIKLPKKNAPIVGISAYQSLISSTIVGKVKINPRNILVINDVVSFYETNIISVEKGADGHCIAKGIDKYRLKNTLFDGQALIDSSVFEKSYFFDEEEKLNGYILLRHHFCKMAAFNTNIQEFFKDCFGDNYESAQVEDMWGNLHFVKDIELITTDNSMKWTNYDFSYDNWCNKVIENDCLFGIVKTAHESRQGDVQRMSYQMVNALDNDKEKMDKVCECTLSYLKKLKASDEDYIEGKTDENEFLKFLERNQTFSTDYKVLIALCNQNRRFLQSDYFRERKRDIIRLYEEKIHAGKIIQNAENLVIVGSPYAMLLKAAGLDPFTDETFKTESGTIQCFTERFSDGEYLAEFRNPFNSKNNIGYLHNVYHPYFKKYFNFGKQIIAINLIGTDFQDRNNGSDQDSDSIYTTNQKEIVECAKYCYQEYSTIVNNIPKDDKKYENTLLSFAELDNKLASALKEVGEASNKAQLCLSYSYNFDDKKYNDYICILSVLAQIAIDNAKRSFDVTLTEEIRKITKEIEIKEHGYPVFWKKIKKDKEYNINESLDCPMNYVAQLCSGDIIKIKEKIPLKEFFVDHKVKVKYIPGNIEKIIENYIANLNNFNYKKNNDFDYSDKNDDYEKYELLQSEFDDLIYEIKTKNKLNFDLTHYLINRAFLITPGVIRNENKLQRTTNKNKSVLLKILYDINPDNVLKCFSKNLK